MLRRVFNSLLLALATIYALPSFGAQNPVLIQGDIVVADRPSARSIAIDDDIQLWPTGIIPYSFGSDLPSASRTQVLEAIEHWNEIAGVSFCLLYTSPSPRDRQKSRMPSSA